MPSSTSTVSCGNSCSSSSSSDTLSAVGSAPRSLRTFLGKPTRKALYVQPPHWLPDHLSILRLQLTDHQGKPPSVNRACLSRLCDAHLEAKLASKRKQLEYVLANPWTDAPRRVNLGRAEVELSNFIYWTAYSFTPTLGESLVLTTAQDCMTGLPYEPIHLQIGKKSVEMRPDFWVSVDGCARFAFSRDDSQYILKNKWIKGESRWQKLEPKPEDDGDTDRGLKPRDGAVLITIAQEKRRRGVLDLSGAGVWSYVFTPSTDRRALFLLAAYFPLTYLNALRHLSRPLEPAIAVHRYRISIDDDVAVLALVSTLLDALPPGLPDKQAEDQDADDRVATPSIKHPLGEVDTNSNKAKRRKMDGDGLTSLVPLECGAGGG